MNNDNYLFILPTNKCGLNCDFCSYADKRKNVNFPELKMDKGKIKIGLENLIDDASLIIFSGGGEPLLNTEFIIDVINLAGKKRYSISTGLGKSLVSIVNDLILLDEVCINNHTTCEIRISLDHFHSKQADYESKIAHILDLYFSKKITSFNISFRSIFTDKNYVLNTIDYVSKIKGWSYSFSDIDCFNSKITINNHVFFVNFKPTIQPQKNGVNENITLKEYIDTCDFYAGKKQFFIGNRRNENGFSVEITIDAYGDIYLYGTEINSLGNIYDGNITFESIRNTILSQHEYRVLYKYPISSIIDKMLENNKISELVNSINYQYEVFKELSPTYNEEILNILYRFDI